MKAVLASILALVLISASFGAGVHAAGYEPSTDFDAVASEDGEDSLAECCDAAGHEMSGSCFMLAGLAPASAGAVPPEHLRRILRPATALPVTADEPDVLRKPPRLL